MRSIVLVIVSLFLVLMLVQNARYPQLKYNQISDRILHPLDMRVRYRIGHIDERFGLSEEQVKQLLQRATYIWQRDTGKAWFVYDEQARLTINFIYDERQQNTVEYQQTQKQIDDMTYQHQKSQQSLQQAQSALDSEFESLQQQIRQLQSQYQALQQQLAYATANEQQYLQMQLSQLDQQKHFLQEKLRAFEANRHQFNQQIDHHNQYAQQLNATIHQAKIKFQPRQFHKGVFNGREINIYQFQSEQDLLLTLAHELGHALDLDHNQDPTALMYPIAQEQDLENFRLKPADLAMLKR